MASLPLLVAAALTATAPDSSAQEVEPPLPPVLPAEAEHDHDAELRRLFAEVELGLARVDDLLYGAAYGESPLEGDLDSGLGGLLDAAESKSDEVVAGLDALIELASGST